MIFHSFTCTPSKKRRLLWISWFPIDITLHKTSVIEVLESLAKRGYTVTLFTARSKRRYTIKDSKVNIVQVPLRQVPILSSIAFTLIAAFILPYYVLFENPAFIVTDPHITILSFLGASILCKLRKIKLILDIRSTPVEVVGFASRLHSFFFGVSVLIARELFDGITVITTSMKEEVCKKFNIDCTFPGVWTSGVSKTLFDPEKHYYKGQKLKKKLGLSNKFIVLYHGVFSARRGLIECIKSMATSNSYTNTNNSNVVLFLLGDGTTLPAIRNEVTKYNLSNVVIHEPVDYLEVPAYIAMCDVGISALPNLPDWRYQSPLNVLEYLSMEKPVIATDIPAHRQIMGKNKCAIYIASAEPSEIAKAIIYAYENRQILRKAGVCGRQIIDECFTWDKIAENFDGYLCSL